METFNALWTNSAQRRRPPDDNFQLFTMEEWMNLSSTHKILTGSFQCPLPPEIEKVEPPQNPSASRPPNTNQGPKPIDKIQLKKENGQNLKANEKMDPPQNPSASRPPNTNQGAKPFDKIQFKKENGQNLKANNILYVPGLVKVPELDRMSALTRDEHRDCLRLFLKYEGQPIKDLTPAEKTEYQLFQSLYARVKEEQKEFIEWAKQNWPQFIDRACKLKGDPHNYVHQHWKEKVMRMMAQYPKYYRKSRKIVFSHDSHKIIRMQLHKNVLNIGRVPVVKLPAFDVPFRVSTSAIRLRTWGLLNVPPSQLAGTLHKVPVSRDPNVGRLARLHGANVVLSSSAIKCLLDNYDAKKHPHHSGVGQSWILPVTVKEHRSFSDGKPVSKTIVYIDKALPRPKMTKFEKVCWYQKHALFAAIVHRHHTAGIEFDIGGHDIMYKERGNIVNPWNSNPKEKQTSTFSSKSSDILGNESGSPTPTRTSDEKQNCGTMVPEHDAKETASNNSDFVPPVSSDHMSSHGDDCSDDERLVLALSDDETDKSTKLDAYGSEPTAEPKPETSKLINSGPLENAPKEETNCSIPSEAVKEIKLLENHAKPISGSTHSQASTESVSKEASSLPNIWDAIPAAPPVRTVNGHALPPNITNVTYNLWSLSPQLNEKELSEGQTVCEGNINLLIRSRIDGCEQLGSGHYQPLSLAVKPEYQLEYGAGAIALSDLTRQWAKLLIQPDSALARVRVHVKTSELIKLEKRTKAEVENEAKEIYQEDLNHTLVNLHGVLSDLMALPSGEYLMSHSPEMGLAAEVFSVTHDEKDQDWYLPTGYGVSPEEICCDVPWQPLDPTAILPKNHFFKNMPCTFQARWAPKLMAKPIKSQPQPQFSSGKKKKNKKKKNKKGIQQLQAKVEPEGT